MLKPHEIKFNTPLDEHAYRFLTGTHPEKVNQFVTWYDCNYSDEQIFCEAYFNVKSAFVDEFNSLNDETDREIVGSLLGDVIYAGSISY